MPIDSTANLLSRPADTGASQDLISKSIHGDGGRYDGSLICMKRQLHISEAISILFAWAFLHLRISQKPF